MVRLMQMVVDARICVEACILRFKRFSAYA
nr:MAG TPA: hypothetical protein [Caudoviricetes sp.]